MRLQFHTGLFLLFTLGLTSLATAAPPAIGDKAPEFALSDMHGARIKLSDLTPKAPVVLVVLRGYPGYQCPYCTRQVQEFVSNAAGFTKAGVSVVFIYPGPPDDLKSKAAESAAGKQLPDNFRMLLDPGYEFTKLYELRWDTPKETAFPSTFLIDRNGVVFFAKISNTHGGRTSVPEILEALTAHKK